MESGPTDDDRRRPGVGDGGEGPASIEIRVNGRDRTVPSGTTVADLLDDLDVDARGVAVERNKRVVPREEHDRTGLEAGDVIEVVQFVGGGRPTVGRGPPPGDRGDGSPSHLT